MARRFEGIETLSPREHEVLRLIAKGNTNPEIAEALGIRFETAKWHVSEVLQKLQVSSRDEAAQEYKQYLRLPSRIGRRFAAIPLIAKWIGTGTVAGGLALAAGYALMVTKFADDAPTLDPGVYVAYLANFQDDFAPGSSDDNQLGAIVILRVDSGETRALGEPRRYRAVWWSPSGKRIAAIALTETPGEADILLMDSESGVTSVLIAAPVEPWNPSVGIGGGPVGFGYAPTLRWSPDDSLLAVAWPGTVRLFSSNGDEVRTPGSICPGNASGHVSWSPSSQYLLQPCIDGVAWLDVSRGAPAFLPWESAGLASPQAPGGLASKWIDDGTVRLTPYGDLPDPAVLELSLSDPGQPRLAAVPDLTDQEILQLQGEPPFSELVARLSDAQRQAFADAGMIISGGAPGATADTWVIGGAHRQIVEHETLALFFDGGAQIVTLPTSWDNNAGPVGVRAGWSWLGPVAHLLFVK